MIRLFLLMALFPAIAISQQKYLFYFHGAVVTRLGDNAINSGAPEWGPYEYSNILDSLRVRGFNVISEIRREGVNDAFYVDQTIKQIDSLLRAGVNPDNIILLGASSGWNIVLQVSSKLRSNDIRFIIMGGCWTETYKDYINIELYGKFLSIIEATDPHGTCYKIFEGRKYISSYKEVTLNTGLSHGFFYKGRKVWIDPILDWL
jgi:hypothetical protein